MAIRLLTKTGGRLSARVHSAFFHLAKGNSLKEKPYGIVPTKEYDDPFGLVFDNTELKVRIKPGQFSCYGRQCIATEETEAVRMGDVYLTSDKLYMTVYARIDLNDQVFQKVDIRYAYNTEAHVDFPKQQIAQNLYRKTNGLYDVPLARFVFHQNPTTPNGYFTDYEKVIETFDDESRAATRKTERIGSKSEARLFENDTFILKADHASHSKGASLIGNTEIKYYLENVWTGRRTSIIEHGWFDFNNTTSKTVTQENDNAHLQYAHIFSECRYKKNNVDYDFYMKFTNTKTEEYTTYAKLNFNGLVEVGKKYYLVLDYKNDRTLNGYHIWDIVISEKEGSMTQITLAWIKVSPDKIEWQGMYDTSKNYVNNIKGQPELVTGFDTSNKFFYDSTRGLGVYVDFIYKGGVTLV